MMEPKNNNTRFTPLIIAVSIILGILIGTFYANHFSNNRLGIINSSSNKLNSLLRIIDDQYVDTVNMKDLIEQALPQILAELDPHSIYIPAKDAADMSSDLEGSFSGIGVQFSIENDTIHVNNIIPGGPAEKAGVIAGDRIVMANDTLIVGPKLTNEMAQHTLKGPKGSKVKIKVMRNGEKKLIPFTITRGDIPQNTIDAAYMLDNNYGYVEISKFARTTHAELLNALAQLGHKGMKGLVIDLRGNLGGYMETAIQMANEFLPAGKLIVFAKGRKYPRTEEYANGSGSCQKLPLIVLIDEGSASSSEIFSGAIQDNDRGMIVGRRSFGKGLVQQPISFSDGSMIRLTIARYYTPSGRCIQRPYTRGNDEKYEMDLLTRYQHGEFFSRDSIKLNKSQRYHTKLGRIVYGGGGIMPDVFVPEDTTGATSYLTEAINRGLVLQYTFQYTDNNRAKLAKFKISEALANYLHSQRLVEQFVRFADKKGIKRRNILIMKSHKLLDKNINASIIYNMLGKEAYLRYINKTDVTVQKALLLLRRGEAFPKAPSKKLSNVNGKRKATIAQVYCVPKRDYSSSTLDELSKAILKKLEVDPLFKRAHTILMYYSLKDEVQTHDFIDKWSNRKTILLPVVVEDDIELRIYTGKEYLAEGAFHINEPTGQAYTNYDTIDLAIVPGVAFDENGNRLGRGKGYYDRLLPHIKATKIGICFPFQLLKRIPTEPFDKKMDKIITL